MLVHLLLSQLSLRLSSVLFILFTLFCSSELIPTILSSCSLIHSSASDILLLIPSTEEKKKGHKKFFEEIIVENFPNTEKEIVNQVQEAQRVPYRINPRRSMPRHILIKLTKTKHKKRILKAAREKQQVTYKRNPICLTAYLSAETLQARGEWQDIFKILKGKNLQPRLLYPARISFKTDGEIKNFSDKQKLREFSTTKPFLQQMLEGLI